MHTERPHITTICLKTRAIRKAFGDAADHVLVNSTKSMVGHLLGAAGGVEAVVCAKSIQDGFVHQTIGTKEADAECDLNYCIGAPVETDVKLAMSNSLGFGGPQCGAAVSEI